MKDVEKTRNNIAYFGGPSAFASRFGIPTRTVQHWMSGDRESPRWVDIMVEEIIRLELNCMDLQEELEGIKGNWPPVESELEKVHGTSNLKEIFG